MSHVSQQSLNLPCADLLDDVAIQILKDCPELATCGGSVLRVLARKPNALRKKHNTLVEMFVPKYIQEGWIDEGNQGIKLFRVIWKFIEKLPKAEIDDMLRGPADENPTTSNIQKYSSRVLFLAAEMGNTAFIIELIRGYPEHLLELNDNNQSIFHVAVSYGHWSIFQLLYHTGSMKDSIISHEDENGNNILHLAAIPKAVTSISRWVILPIAFRIFRELQGFNNVNITVPPSLRKKKNTAGLTPRELFRKNHKDGVSEFQEWVAKTSSQLMVVAALTATISFAATITFPGGYNTQNGAPVLMDNQYFDSFMLYNGLSFILAITSILPMISLMGPGDPYFKLVFSPGALTGSLTFMVAAFKMNFSLLYNKRSQTMPHFITVLFYIVYLLVVYCMFTSFGYVMVLAYIEDINLI